ncbi:hypothetical protein NDU88_002144 [Pleurodeles waltl]|uniref:Uncharacterized protein n=1 Tax=Pleurodeles waltl TaxID=8319 RepID=A0AAV7WP54_PLEWA|nr:hypothetical protein NDU88_002144 [Pleurodeles waltl]
MAADASNRPKPDLLVSRPAFGVGVGSSGCWRLVAEAAAVEIPGPTAPELSKSRKAHREGAGKQLYIDSANNFRGYHTSKWVQPHDAPAANSVYERSVHPAQQ